MLGQAWDKGARGLLPQGFLRFIKLSSVYCLVSPVASVAIASLGPGPRQAIPGVLGALWSETALNPASAMARSELFVY